jgi:hypothetical protein
LVFFFLSLLFPPELTEEQLKILVKSLEKKILPVQLKLVRKSDRLQGEFRVGQGWALELVGTCRPTVLTGPSLIPREVFSSP